MESDGYNFLQLLVDIYDWEKEHCALCETVAGRHLYYAIARQVLADNPNQGNQLKSLYNNQEFSERALRYKVREFEGQGLIGFETGPLDKRSKRIIPSAELLNQFVLQARFVKGQIERKYFLIDSK